MNIIATDMGMQTGFSVVKDSAFYKSGTVSFKSKDEGNAYVCYTGWLREMISIHDLKEIVIEDVQGRWVNKYAQRYYFGFRAITVMLASRYHLRMNGYHQATLKKLILGHGKADKADAITYYRSKGILIENDDHADALMLSEVHMKILSGEVVLPEKKKKKKKKSPLL